MLPRDPVKWLHEIREDERERDKRLNVARKMVAGFHGFGYAGEESETFDNPENHAFKMVSSILPVLAYSNPQVTVESGKNGEAQEWVEALQHGIDRWIELTRYHRLAEKLATDYCFSWAGTLTSVVTRPGFEEAEDPPMWPQAARLSPHQWGWDRLAYSFEEKRYAWHKVVIDKDALIRVAERDAELPEEERDGWDIKAVKSMATKAGVQETRPTQEVRDGEVSYYEVWVPSAKVDDEHTAERGYHGAIYRFAECGNMTDSLREGRQICAPFDYWGPRWGPYTLYGCFTVPDHSWPLSVLMATYSQEAELNGVAKRTNESARNYKRAGFADDEELVNLVNEAEHDNFYYHPNLMASKIETAEFGGVSDQMIAQEARLRDALERNSGLTEVEQGNLSGVTATETAVATSAASKRQSFYVRKFGDGARANLETILWFLANNDRIVYDLSPEQANEMASRRPGEGFENGAEFEGGPDREEQGTLDDLELTVDIRSMGHRSQQEEAQDGVTKMSVVSELANLAVTSPVNVRALAEQIGQKMGWPDLVDLIDFEMAEEMHAMNMQVMAQGGQSQGPSAYTPASQPKPRLALASIGKSAGRKAFEGKPKTVGAA